MENIVILISFVGLCVLYFVYLHKKLMQKLENKIEAAKYNLINSNNLIKEYEVKIAELEENLLKLDENFKLTCSEIEVEIEHIKQKKIATLQTEINAKQKQIESEASLQLEMHQIAIKNKIIETAYLLTVEYFKNHKEYSEENKKKMIEQILKNIKIQ